ncbi:MAG TPA: hypothetical protein VGH28_00325 [Polyangiaceae bacterium]|jgi:hypothetical protein
MRFAFVFAVLACSCCGGSPAAREAVPAPLPPVGVAGPTDAAIAKDAPADLESPPYDVGSTFGGGVAEGGTGGGGPGGPITVQTWRLPEHTSDAGR